MKILVKKLKPAFIGIRILFKLFSPIFPKRHIIGCQNDMFNFATQLQVSHLLNSFIYLDISRYGLVKLITAFATR